MPYNTGYRRFKRTYGPRRTFKRSNTLAASVRKLAADVRKLKVVTKPEYKVIEGESTGTANTTGALVLMNGLVQGDELTQRIGRQVTFHSVQVALRNLKATNPGTTLVCWAIVLDKQPNGAAFSLSNIYSNANAQWRNLDYRRRFVILKEGRMTLDADDIERNIKFFQKLDITTIYDDTDGGTIADISTNSIYFLTSSNQASSDGAGFTFNFRMRYTDC